MKDKIKLIFDNKLEGSIEILNKIDAKKKFLDFFDTHEIEKITINYKR